MTDFSWSQTIKTVPAEQRDALSILLEILGKHAPTLASGESEGEFSAVTRDKVLKNLRTRAALRMYLACVNLARGILNEAVSELRWRCVPLPTHQLVRNSPARHNPATFLQSRNIASIRMALIQSLEDIPILSDRERIAQLAIAAVLDGLTVANMISNLQRIPLSATTNIDNFAICVPLRIDSVKYRDDSLRRWITPPISKLLLQRIQTRGFRFVLRRDAEQPELDAVTLWSICKEFLLAYGIARDKLPKTLAAFCSWCAADMGFAIAPASVDYAGWQTPSVSLEESAWGRLRTDQGAHSRLPDPSLPTSTAFKGQLTSSELTDLSIAVRDAVRVSRSAGPTKPPSIAEVALDHSAEWVAIRTISRALRKNDSNAAITELSTQRSNVCPAFRHLIDWALSLLSANRKDNSRSRLSTVDRYFRQIAKPWVSCACHIELGTLDPDEFQELYGEILATQTTQPNLEMTSQVLLRFHRFLVDNELAPDIDFAEVEGFTCAQIAVNANIISDSEMSTAFELLRDSADTSRSPLPAAWLLAMLAYRTGMRRLELRRLRIGDVRGKRLLDIQIRRSKTRSGERTIPAYDLLSEQELVALAEFRNELVERKWTNDSFLFSTSPGNESPPKLNSEFARIRSVLSKVTGDEKVRFHTLRHTFITRYYMIHNAARLPLLRKLNLGLFTSTPETPLECGTPTTLLVPGVPSRRVLFELAILAGHSTPTVTLLHYIHLADVVLWAWLTESTPKLNPQQAAALFGYKKSRAHDLLKPFRVENKQYDILAALSAARPVGRRIAKRKRQRSAKR